MKLLRELLQLQHAAGYLSDDALRDMAERTKVPLYRVEELVSFYPAFRRHAPPAVVIDVCRDACCTFGQAAPETSALATQLDLAGIDYEIREVSCLGRCDAAPALCVNDVPLAPLTCSAGTVIVEHCRRLQSADGHAPVSLASPATSAANFRCNPYSDSEQQYGTVRALATDVAQLKSQTITRLKGTNLTGRGGAGFPTGLKWELVSKEVSPTKYVICNADESEPGTFKDREILRHLPHLVIEGMLLAGLTVGAENGIVYIRHEYGPEEQILQAAIDEAYARGILGENAAGSRQRFELEIFVSPGGYILGEETALLEALEDKRGEPRNKPPYPGQVGLWDQPTLINNVETFAMATTIIAQGPDWWKRQGIGGFEGLKFVCVSGDVAQPGVYEVPMGTSFATVIELAGGMRDGVPLKAFLPGGASSLFLRAEAIETPIDFGAVKQAGSMLGTGAIMVFNQQRNLYDIALNLTRFFRNESCGKCVPCRVGSQKGVALLEAVAAGEQPTAQLGFLDELHETLQESSICGLGQVALAPVLSMLKQFPEEIPQHG